MYADTMTDSMRSAIEETDRRREKQIASNLEHGIDPQPLRKKIADITDMLAREDADTDALVAKAGGRRGQPVPTLGAAAKGERELGALPTSELAKLVGDLTEQMHEAAKQLQFETAARLRDEIADLKKTLRQMVEATK